MRVMCRLKGNIKRDLILCEDVGCIYLAHVRDLCLAPASTVNLQVLKRHVISWVLWFSRRTPYVIRHLICMGLGFALLLQNSNTYPMPSLETSLLR